MGKLNCWNWKNCGRYPGGPNASDLGVCPAATDNNADGYLGGRGAGRACIYLTGTLCGGKVQGSYGEKHENCLKCDYYQAMKIEFGNELSVVNYNNYTSKTGYKKAVTNSKQDWVAKTIAPQITAENAKDNYS